ncbi:hypothetical protein BU25DRAFT_482612 [Macroventuria anomochaeta]|uniref:Uncharacterized protein n=1 Tax=Macroventuria anomochaeta TaxID=301207 RepID=A0ACB6RKY8_9PLEO|nr:uncharacterized protein BU25DRAFT_482612 [Macroventuria anomochaeta]KAF2621637.1 hypothetical protein BU25DRAFT_482612 [Macroventuria anomochaeta]
MAVSPLRNQSFAQNPSSSPLRPPHVQQPGKPNLNDMPQKIFLAALQSNRTLVPANPVNNPLNSQRIDAVAHAMWQVIFINENMMKGITTKASMLPQLKLRALARLNYLPSWWFIREMACGVMARQGWLMDDSEMQGLWKETVEWCTRVEIKVGMQGDSAAATKQEERLVQAPTVRERVLKVES